MASSMAKEARNSPTADLSRTCSNEGSGKNKHGNGMPLTESKVGPMQPIHHGCE